MENTPTLEVVRFRPVAGATAESLLEASRAIEPTLQELDGYQRRETGVREDGTLVDVVLWRDHASAMAAAEQFPKLPGVERMMSLIDPESVEMEHYALR